MGMLALLSGCGILRPGIPGSGVKSSELRQVGEFDEVHLSGFGTVNVVAGESPSVLVSTDDNLLAHVDTWVENGKLNIRPRRLISPKSELHVDVTTPYLTAAHVTGIGDLNIIDVVGDQLDLSISGAGSIYASGYVKSVSASISGAGEADLQTLYAENASVAVSGVGDAKVHATESMKATISGAGDIECHGNPANVDQHVSGAGNIRVLAPQNPAQFTISDTPDLD